jgi:hypothetical protein
MPLSLPTWSLPRRLYRPEQVSTNGISFGVHSVPVFHFLLFSVSIRKLAFQHWPICPFPKLKGDNNITVKCNNRETYFNFSALHLRYIQTHTHIPLNVQKTFNNSLPCIMFYSVNMWRELKIHQSYYSVEDSRQTIL